MRLAMSNDTGPNARKRTRVLDDLDEDLEGYGKRDVPPPPVELPGGYKDEANPFGDAQLSAPFQWKLRNQKLAKEGHSTSLTESEEAAQRESTIVRTQCKSGDRAHFLSISIYGTNLLSFCLI